uniref:Uncharacterized protein ORF-c22_010 n=1 Tax=Saccharolobus solfataricus TaxID=2287 RepID=Q9UWU6_SACSO|nr:hypothetical protein [Saccharolobus solfataricus P2]
MGLQDRQVNVSLQGCPLHRAVDRGQWPSLNLGYSPQAHPVGVLPQDPLPLLPAHPVTRSSVKGPPADLALVLALPSGRTVLDHAIRVAGRTSRSHVLPPLYPELPGVVIQRGGRYIELRDLYSHHVSCNG